ncbi:MAG: ankyrin repeat domain-containing protein [Armatimonadota bacterium]
MLRFTLLLAVCLLAGLAQAAKFIDSFVYQGTLYGRLQPLLSWSSTYDKDHQGVSSSTDDDGQRYEVGNIRLTLAPAKGNAQAKPFKVTIYGEQEIAMSLQAAVILNGKPVKLAQPAIVVAKDTYLPVKALAVPLGQQVTLDAGQRMVTLRHPVYHAKTTLFLDPADAVQSQAIIILAEQGKTERVTELLQANPKLLQARDMWGNSLLYHAAGSGQLDLVKALLDKGLDLRETGWGNWSPLHMGAVAYPPVLALLLENGADARAAFVFGGVTLLHEAVEAEQPESVELLLKYGADPNAKADYDMIVSTGDNYHGITPLHIAMRVNQYDCARLLLDHGADPNGAGARPDPLSMAIEFGDLRLVKLLVDRGAAIDGKDGAEGWHHLQLAATVNKADIIRYLIEKGIPVDARDPQGRTPLMIASDNNALAAARQLLDSGADPKAQDHAGATPLHYALYSVDMARLLLDRGADVNARDQRGATPLSRATAREDKALADFLRSRGAK